jgi:hypothetical protein
MKPQFKSVAEMQRIRESDAKLRAEQNKKIIPEPNVYKPLAYFECGRYTTGAFRGLFAVFQLIVEDEQGRKLKTPIRKPVSDGDDFFMASGKMAEAFRRRVYAQKKK